eukprot:CAMPEP_0174291494 /NCGR_PEP_ID=MMETSP0809-20121228/32247_1 /TAXON_ID=73025 ORGANISM="Eutreptiella gymnastica-like, Strain CCMP1594" /NCGR_SAMPLE_ID=MMETSP0809 /ASSEMBLY_ACC=CAM_ASM_000658 /LENGTH=40 /DNA_ID= /DNA_START= /DNA_END= /DNA_ORIENTATION=
MRCNVMLQVNKMLFSGADISCLILNWTAACSPVDLVQDDL